VRVSVVENDGGGNEDSFTGILLKSHTSDNHRHLLVNAHSFLDDDSNPVSGFPKEFEEQIKKAPKGHGRHRKRRRDETADPIKIRVEQLQFFASSGSKTEKFVTLFEVICPNDVKLCSRRLDALVLFDKEIQNTLAAPVFAEITRSQRVHLFGFAHITEHSWFSVPGEVHSVKDGSAHHLSKYTWS